MVPGVGLEPTRDCSHTILSRTRKPIPPPGRFLKLTNFNSFFNYQAEHIICVLSAGRR